MKIKRFSILLALSAIAVSGCVSRGNEGFRTVKMVERILSDTTSATFRALSAGSGYGSNGTIAVIGAPSDVLPVTEILLSCDVHDNVSGSFRADELPDFSGETIVPVIDAANSPYEGYFDKGDKGFFRELNVQNFLWTMDTVALQSPYDTLNGVFKQRAKIVVLASTHASAYGLQDIDTLRRTASSAVPVFAPVQSMAEYVFTHRSGAQNIAVWTSAQINRDSVYQKLLPEEFAERGETASSFHVFSPAADSSSVLGHNYYRSGGVGDYDLHARFIDILDSYMLTGKTGRLTALFMDDDEVSYNDLRVVVDEILNTEEDNLLIYKNMLAPDFLVITPGQAIAEQCYRYLRQNNLFTHKISYPDMKAYVTVPKAGFEDADGGLPEEFRYGRTEGSFEPGYTFVLMKDRYVSDSLLDVLLKYYPKTFSLYVR